MMNENQIIILGELLIILLLACIGTDIWKIKKCVISTSKEHRKSEVKA